MVFNEKEKKKKTRVRGECFARFPTMTNKNWNSIRCSKFFFLLRSRLLLFLEIVLYCKQTIKSENDTVSKMALTLWPRFHFKWLYFYHKCKWSITSLSICCILMAINSAPHQFVKPLRKSRRKYENQWFRFES